MNKAELLKLGAFASPEALKRDVKWTDENGKEHVFPVTVLPRTAGSVLRGREMAQEGEDRAGTAVYLATFIRIGDEGEQLSYEDCLALKAELFDVLLTAVIEVHGKRKELPKNSRPPKKSSAS